MFSTGGEFFLSCIKIIHGCRLLDTGIRERTPPAEYCTYTNNEQKLNCCYSNVSYIVIIHVVSNLSILFLSSYKIQNETEQSYSIFTKTLLSSP